MRRLDTPDGEMALYEAEPEGPARAAVVVLQEAFGVNPHIEEVTPRFAVVGYRAVAPTCSTEPVTRCSTTATSRRSRPTCKASPRPA